MSGWRELLFETPWWLPTLLAMIGIAVFLSGNRRQKWHVRNNGVIIIGLAIALVLVSYFVDTDKEKAVNKTRQLVQAVVKRDATTLKAILDPRTQLTNSENQLVVGGQTSILAMAVAAAETYKLQSATITRLDARQEQTVITINMGVFTSSAQDRSTLSTYQVTWQERSDGWHLTTIQVLTIDNQPSGNLVGRLPIPNLP